MVYGLDNVYVVVCVCQGGSRRRESLEASEKESGGRGKPVRKVTKETKGGAKRGRGRPRLTEEEKQRRKELRELGLMKRSHRRTKEGKLLFYCVLMPSAVSY